MRRLLTNNGDQYIVLVGEVGSGKTTLFNKITGAQNVTSGGSESATREVEIRLAAHGNTPFKVADTPGLNSETPDLKLHHTISIKEAIAYAPVNLILLVLNGGGRIGPPVNGLDGLLLHFPDDAFSHVAVVLTHLDKLEQNCNGDKAAIEREKQNYRNRINQSLGTEKIFFVGANTTSDQMCAEISLQMNPAAITVNIPTKDIHKTFGEDLAKSLDLRLKRQVDTFVETFERDVANPLIKLIRGYVDVDPDSFFHHAMLAISDLAHEKIREFVNENSIAMTEIKDYIIYVTLKMKISAKVKKVREEAQRRMSYSLLDPKDPRNLIKKCPNCHLIWFKVYGCNGSTSCGNRPTDFAKDKGVLGTYFRFNYDNNTRKFSYNREDRAPATGTPASTGNNTGRYLLELAGALKLTLFSLWYNQGQEDRAPTAGTPDPTRDDTVNPAGCGAKFVWKNLPPLPQDQFNLIMQKLKEIGVDDVLALEDNTINNVERIVQTLPQVRIEDKS